MNKVFISTPLGFEMSTLQEMKECWPYLLGKDAKSHALPFPEVEVISGGLEFETDLFAALQLNFFLKTANRLLVRMASFRTKDLPKFYQKFKSLPWKDYLSDGQVGWEVAAQKSRLNNEKRLQQSAEKALLEIFGSSEIKKTASEKSELEKTQQTIYIRMDDDLCTISLDSTGEHLHKRGWSTLKGEAPLRETIAAYLLRETMGEFSPAELKKITLFDPMMGAGTFLTEARSLWQGQFGRGFSFQGWKNSPKLFKSTSFIYNYQLPNSGIFKAFLGMDIEEKMLKVCRTNFDEVERQIAVQEKEGFNKSELQLYCQNSLQVQDFAGTPCLWMMVNPPYGERLSEATRGGLNALADSLCSSFKPNKLGILYPEKERLGRLPDGYTVEKEIKINNGGIRCLYTLLTTL